MSELLTTGRTSVLSDKPIVSRAIVPAGYQRRNLIRDQNLGKQVREITRRTAKKESLPEEVRFAEETIMRSIMGRARPAGVWPAAREMKAPRGPKKNLKLVLEVVRGDVTQIEAPVVVIGHYQGVAPVSAEGAIDKALDFWISRVNRQGIIGAGQIMNNLVNQIWFVPTLSLLVSAIKEKARFYIANLAPVFKFLNYLIGNFLSAASSLSFP